MLKVIKIISLFVIIGVFMSACSNKPSESYAKEVNHLLKTDVLEDSEIVLLDKTSKNGSIFYAIELTIDSNKLENLLESKTQITYMDFELQEEIINECINSNKFSKDLSLCDKEYQFLYRIEEKGRKGLIPITRNVKTYAHFYVYDNGDNSFVCIRSYRTAPTAE